MVGKEPEVNTVHIQDRVTLALATVLCLIVLFWLITQASLILIIHQQRYTVHPLTGLFFLRSYSINLLLLLKLFSQTAGNVMAAYLPWVLKYNAQCIQ